MPPHDALTNRQVVSWILGAGITALGIAGTVFLSWAGSVMDDIEINHRDITELQQSVTKMSTSLEYIARGISDIKETQKDTAKKVDELRSQRRATLPRN
tara:strand:+ start:449 stop:745 length:297 start_codon:yes stop_codon:yes gene_type:complete